LFHRCAFQKRNKLHFLGDAAAAQRLAVTMEHERTSSKTTARPPAFVCCSKQHHGFRQKFLTVNEVEKRPALYNKATPEYSDKNCKENLMEPCGAVVPNWSRLDKTARAETCKKRKKNYVHCNLFVQTVEYSFTISLKL
jgi:hypothetical protein